jgi:ABC-2 type transport system permease protein
MNMPSEGGSRNVGRRGSGYARESVVTPEHSSAQGGVAVLHESSVPFERPRSFCAGRALGKYWALARIAAALTRAERGELVGRCAFLAVMLGVFSALWRAVAEAGMPIAQRPESLIWYLATTEWVLLSTPQLHFQIEREVRRGDVAYQLLRPLSYGSSWLAQGLGALSVRAPVLAVAAGAAAWAFAGGLPEHSEGFLYAIPFGLVAMLVLLLVYGNIGLLAFWLGDVAPIQWVVGKLGFVFGGLMLPLELYPDLVQQLARLTPFPSILYGPARFLLGAGRDHALGLALGLVAWSAMLAAVSALSYRRALRTLSVNGG